MPERKILHLKTPRWYALEQTAELAELTIDGIIGGSYWSDDGVNAKRFIEDLNLVTAPRIELHINSPGGDVFTGYQIYNALVAWSRAAVGRELVVIVDGLAASIASVIAMAGDSIAMPAASVIMIHNPWAMTVGDAEEHRRAATELDTIARQIAKVYSDRTGQTIDRCRELMADETYFDADEALALGFATEIIENKQQAAACDVAADIFGSAIPTEIIKKQKAKKKRDHEKRLRDAGYSRSRARAYASDQCDADTGLFSEIKNFINELKGFKNG